MGRVFRNCFVISVGVSLCLYLLQAFLFSKAVTHLH